MGGPSLWIMGGHIDCFYQHSMCIQVSHQWFGSSPVVEGTLSLLFVSIIGVLLQCLIGGQITEKTQYFACVVSGIKDLSLSAGKIVKFSFVLPNLYGSASVLKWICFILSFKSWFWTFWRIIAALCPFMVDEGISCWELSCVVSIIDWSRGGFYNLQVSRRCFQIPIQVAGLSWRGWWTFSKRLLGLNATWNSFVSFLIQDA